MGIWIQYFVILAIVDCGKILGEPQSAAVATELLEIKMTGRDRLDLGNGEWLAPADFASTVYAEPRKPCVSNKELRIENF